MKPAISKVAGFDFDFSFEALFYSVSIRDFSNYTKNQQDFVYKIFEIASLISKVKDKDFFKELIQDAGMKHCHILDSNKVEIVHNCVRQSLSIHGTDDIESVISDKLKFRRDPDKTDSKYTNKKLYQVGFERSVRLIGTFDEEMDRFEVFLIDYHHKLYPDEKFNDMGKNTHKFCIKKTK